MMIILLFQKKILSFLTKKVFRNNFTDQTENSLLQKYIPKNKIAQSSGKQNCSKNKSTKEVNLTNFECSSSTSNLNFSQNPRINLNKITHTNRRKDNDEQFSVLIQTNKFIQNSTACIVIEKSVDNALIVISENKFTCNFMDIILKLIGNMKSIEISKNVFEVKFMKRDMNNIKIMTSISNLKMKNNKFVHVKNQEDVPMQTKNFFQKLFGCLHDSYQIDEIDKNEKDTPN